MVDDFKAARLQEKRWQDENDKDRRQCDGKPCLEHPAIDVQLCRALRLSVVKSGEGGVEFLDEGSGRMRIVSLEEEIAYLAAASKPLKDVARIILDTGMRPEEVFRTEIGNIDLIEKSIFNPFGKTRAARRKLTMTDDVLSVLKKLVSAARTNLFSRRRMMPTDPSAAFARRMTPQSCARR